MPTTQFSNEFRIPASARTGLHAGTTSGIQRQNDNAKQGVHTLRNAIPWQHQIKHKYPALAPLLNALNAPGNATTPQSAARVLGTHQLFDATRFMLESAPEHPLTDALLRESLATHFSKRSRVLAYPSSKPLCCALLKYQQDGGCGPTLKFSLDHHLELPSVIAGFKHLQEITIEGYFPRSNLDTFLKNAWPELKAVHLSTEMPLGILKSEQSRLQNLRPKIQWDFVRN